jgi:imidazolonepropionase-like amidohydrolase
LKLHLKLICYLFISSLFFNITPGFAQTDSEVSQILITNVNIFNGVDNNLSKGMNVLVVDNKISKISPNNIQVDENAIVIDADGKTLMPGLIDGHAHLMMNADFGPMETNMDITDMSYRAVVVVERYLMDGFTTVRDEGGPAFGLQRNIDSGLIIGPRIYPSGAFISQTSGHGDFRDRSDAGFAISDLSDRSNFERFGFGMVADGIPEVLKATRLNLRNGATQIKIMAGGGGASRFDPIDTTQYSKEEVCAIVETAKDWGTYVSAHVFTDRAMNRLMECGVMSFEHGFFMSEDTMKKISEKGIYVVPQMWGISPDLARNPLMAKDKIPMVKALGKQYKDFGRNLLKNNVKVVFASDYVGKFEDAERARRYELWWRTQTFDSNYEVLKQLTSTAGELMAMINGLMPIRNGNRLRLLKL